MPEPGWLVDNVPLTRVDTLDKLDECRRWAGERRETPLFADTESGGLDPHRHRHRLSQLGDMWHGWAFPPAWFGAFNEIVRRHGGLIGFHNSPYDWRVLKVHQGIEPAWERTEDSNLLCRLGNSADKADLKGQAVKKVDPLAAQAQAELKYSMRRNGWTWDTVPDEWEPYWRYAALDPVLTAHLWQLHAPVRARYSWAYDLERATARICTNMMMNGMLLDAPYVTERIREITQYVEHARAWLADAHGVTNVNSNAQVAAAFEAAGIPLTIRTEHDNPSFDKDALKTYRFMYPDDAALIDAITWCRKGESLVSRYLEKFLAMAGPDGVVHYTIHSCQARTTRMSITDPPMQTFDRDVPFVRGSFRPRPGHVFITIDADQIEARLAAHFSRDANMIAEFRRCDAEGLKFFIEMASKVYREKITKRDPRYTWVKNATYAQIYGSGLAKAAATAGVPTIEMEDAYNGLAELYPNVKRLMNRLIWRAKDSGVPSVRIIDGRDLRVDPGHEYALLNTLIQGSAAVIMKKGLVDLDAAGFGPYLRLVVHDEVMIEAPQEWAKDMLAEAERILTDTTNFAVPITWHGDILEERWVKT